MNKKIEEFSIQLEEELKKSALPDESTLGLYCYDISAEKNVTVEEGSLIHFSAEEPVAKFLVRDGKVYVTPTTEDHPIKYKEKNYPLKSGIEINPGSLFTIGGHKFVINDLQEMDLKTAKSMLAKNLISNTLSAKQGKLEEYYQTMEEIEAELDDIQQKNHQIHQQIEHRKSRTHYLEQLHEKYSQLKVQLQKIHAEAKSVGEEVKELNGHDFEEMLENLAEQEAELTGEYTEIEKHIKSLEKDIRRRSETQVNKKESKKQEQLSKIEQEEAELLKKLQELEAKKKGIA